MICLFSRVWAIVIQNTLPHTSKLHSTEQRCPAFSFYLILLNHKGNAFKAVVNRKTTSPWLCCSDKLPGQFANNLRNLLLLAILAFKLLLNSSESFKWRSFPFSLLLKEIRYECYFYKLHSDVLCWKGMRYEWFAYTSKEKALTKN